jgi:hypothetical protein
VFIFVFNFDIIFCQNVLNAKYQDDEKRNEFSGNLEQELWEQELMKHSKQSVGAKDKEDVARKRGLKKDYDYVLEDLSEMFVSQPLLEPGTINPDQVCFFFCRKTKRRGCLPHLSLSLSLSLSPPPKKKKKKKKIVWGQWS